VERAAVRVGLDWNEDEAEIRLFLFVFSEIISVGNSTTWPADCLSFDVYGNRREEGMQIIFCNLTQERTSSPSDFWLPP
jgi:hypothetical protein